MPGANLLCLASQLEPATVNDEGENTVVCNPPKAVADGLLFVGTPTSDKAQTVVGVVTDGIVAVTSSSGAKAEVTGNAYILEGAGTDLTFITASGAGHTVDIGAIVPATTVEEQAG